MAGTFGRRYPPRSFAAQPRGRLAYNFTPPRTTDLISNSLCAVQSTDSASNRVAIFDPRRVPLCASAPLREKADGDAPNRFCSYGVWVQTGRHPFAEAFTQTLIPALPLAVREPDAVRTALRQEFARLAAEDAKALPAVAEAAIAAVAAEPPFTLTAQRRMRHWVDGLVIGSELFVRETMRRVRSDAEVGRHRLAKAAPEQPDTSPICCWRRLRVMRN